MYEKIFECEELKNVKLNFYDPREWILNKTSAWWKNKETFLKQKPEEKEFILANHSFHRDKNLKYAVLDSDLKTFNYPFNELDIWKIGPSFYCVCQEEYESYIFGPSKKFTIYRWLKFDKRWTPERGLDKTSYKEINNFWNSTRRKNLNSLNISPKSIIQDKKSHKTEKIKEDFQKKISKQLEALLFVKYKIENLQEITTDDFKNIIWNSEDLVRKTKDYRKNKNG